MNELRLLHNKELQLRKLYDITKDMSDEEIDYISDFYVEDNLSKEDFLKIIRKVKIKFKGL